ncbi:MULTISPECIES: hypothetical protein [unclassified Methylobacterium]|uniref:hypothetical protein n=1 Tax=unclassified Methylobacterium TaxID=2615210 RepID=UPI000CC79A17|nr:MULTISPECIES: hypothetical protein [unclassified Methylobacterium]PIU05070.1 MAG: hypothetical protein COT56_16480 [Methylobacterium sp. CG09_land_8_20_14_0_10_71_15]PIU11860.1 MAG: hypothetical protein COT28_17835 [Methylobacterium sp. CG08_land_8_20_14_0_20_71_15]GBU19027.1 hypothetical protein AwMethylo_32420 [Methylobacterium sp.]
MKQHEILVIKIADSVTKSGKGPYGDGKNVYERFRDDLLPYTDIENIDRMFDAFRKEINPKILRGEMCVAVNEQGGVVGFLSREQALRNSGRPFKRDR